VLFSVLLCASLNKFTCVSGSRPCIPARFICDGDNDCTDASDERYCDTGRFIIFAGCFMPSKLMSYYVMLYDVIMLNMLLCFHLV